MADTTPNQTDRATAHACAARTEPHGPTSPNQAAPKTHFTEAQIESILAYTRSILQTTVRNEPPAAVLPADINAAPTYGVFVTLRRPTLLRGCRGRWGEPTHPLGDCLSNVIRDTAIFDPRFPSITPEELPYLGIDVSLMFDPTVVRATGEDRIESIEVGTHGLVLNHPKGRGLLLPHVATEAGWDAKTFLDHVAVKAGLPPDTWRRDPRAMLMTFKTKLLRSEPPKAELDIQQLQVSRMHRLLDRANQWLEDEAVGQDTDPILNQHLEPMMGVHVQTESGSTATAIGPGHSLLELTAASIRSLKEMWINCGQTQTESVRRIVLLWQPIRLKPTDYPDRHRLLADSAIRIRRDGQWRLVLPDRTRALDTVTEALGSMHMVSHDWRSQDPYGSVELTAFAVMPFEARERPGGQLIRQPARNGQFYPADPQAMQQQIDEHLAAGSYPHTSQETVRAVMLPHAGWRFCGDTIGKTLARVRVPETVIIAGPKHTPHGANWSVAPHQRWNLPGCTVPIAIDLVRRLVESIPGLTCEPDAHRLEHGSEVLLPFLYRLQPRLRVVPIVLGQSPYESTAIIAEGLARMIDELEPPPLLIISSDLNHFAPEPENRRLDQMALDAMLSGSPTMLYDTCEDHQISMCGLLPAVTMLQALGRTKPPEPELVDYCNSAKVTGDTSRVVGYAGVLIR